MKEKLIAKYGEKQAEVLLNKFTEDEIYENGFLEKELPEDPKYKEMFLEQEKQIKELKALLEDKTNHIHKLNEENKDKRLNLENEKLTKDEMQQKLQEIQKQLENANNELENKKDYDNYKQFYDTQTKLQEEQKLKLLEKVEEGYREIYSKLDVSEIERLISNEQPSKTPGLDNNKVPTSNDSLGGLKDLFNALKG